VDDELGSGIECDRAAARWPDIDDLHLVTRGDQRLDMCTRNAHVERAVLDEASAVARESIDKGEVGVIGRVE
jgi:hypothetical protein